ncbi:MAG: hypothetical protein WC570_00655 [Patescibacteria group bacterium]
MKLSRHFDSSPANIHHWKELIKINHQEKKHPENETEHEPFDLDYHEYRFVKPESRRSNCPDLKKSAKEEMLSITKQYFQKIVCKNIINGFKRNRPCAPNHLKLFLRSPEDKKYFKKILMEEFISAIKKGHDISHFHTVFIALSSDDSVFKLLKKIIDTKNKFEDKQNP